MASRLSENPQWKVLLLEAGGDPPAESEVIFFVIFSKIFRGIFGISFDLSSTLDSCIPFESSKNSSRLELYGRFK